MYSSHFHWHVSLVVRRLGAPCPFRSRAARRAWRSALLGTRLAAWPGGASRDWRRALPSVCSLARGFCFLGTPHIPAPAPALPAWTSSLRLQTSFLPFSPAPGSATALCRMGRTPTAAAAIRATGVLQSHCSFPAVSLIPMTKSAQPGTAPVYMQHHNVCSSHHRFCSAPMKLPTTWPPPL